MFLIHKVVQDLCNFSFRSYPPIPVSYSVSPFPVELFFKRMAVGLSRLASVLAKTISIWFVFHQAVNSKKQEMLYIWNRMHSIHLSFSLALLSMPVALLACRFWSSLDGLQHSLDVSTLDHDIPQLVGQQWCPIYYSMDPDFKHKSSLLYPINWIKSN